ncbi:hypothetical protein [Salinirubrum litoreum]|uniref:Uncharacterized protein n=1 Tax=Salinirubrum litoreum TaxID=1126234 RepID=A0ABD5RCS5_9EURY|nr:hypothetical protein [Salinirubrum litoreum]
MTGDTLTVRFAATSEGHGDSVPGDARPTAAALGQFCRQLDIAYRLLWNAAAPPADADPTAFASAVATGGVSVTPREDIAVPLRVRRVTSDFGLSLTLVGESAPTRGVVRLCGWTPADQPAAEGVTLDSLAEAQTSLAGGIGELKTGLGSGESSDSGQSSAQ